jgi:primosomal protein N' (replication factor Y)
MDGMTICKVCIPNTFGYVYDYLVGDSLPAIGTRVLVPFRQSEKTGFVWGHESQTAINKPLKSILKTDDVVVFDQYLIQFCNWMADYYHSPLSEILALACPKWVRDFSRNLSLPQPVWYQLTSDYTQKLEQIPTRSKRLKQLLTQLDFENSLASLKTKGFKKADIQHLLDWGICQEIQQFVTVSYSAFPALELQLNAEQQLAVDAVQFQQFSVYLLQGVTGSGKTEVYIELMKKVIANRQQVLMLVPEIGLTTSLHQRIQARLGLPVILFHSSLTDKQRYENWLKVYTGQGVVVLGTRSAVFSHLPHVGLIIIDEEHDPSFKQTDGIRYSAKDAAIMRAKLHDVPIILGSATPCLETYQNVLNHKYKLLTLNSKALNQTALQYQVVDLRSQSVEHGLAQKTLQMMEKHLRLQHQVLVFINRRGYSPLIYCHDCGWAKHCLNCDAHMTWHRKTHQLMCHHCGQQSSVPHQCESCFSHQLIPLGVGTERLLEFLTSYFPDVSAMRFDRDVVKNRLQLDDCLQQIEQQKVQLIVGTQMLTKGHHFPNLGLVVIVDGDSGFYHADFRALERLGQVFTQVAGRAGRAHIPGEVCIQTHLPHHPLLQVLLNKGYIELMYALLQQRREAFLPPFSHMALLRAQGKNSHSVQQFLKHMMKRFDGETQISILGPAPAPMEKKAGLFRWQLIFKSSQRSTLHHVLKQFIPMMQNHQPKGVRCFVEIDPYDWSA